MHQVHTLNPGCTHRPRTLRPSRPCRGPCRSLWPVVSQAWLAVSWPCRRPSTDCIVTLPAPCRACLAIQPSGQATRCIATHNAAPYAQYEILYCDNLPSQAMHARAAACPARRPTVSWPCCGRIAGLVAHQPGGVVAPRLRPSQPLSYVS